MRKRLVPITIIAVGILGFILLKVTRPVPEPVTPTERSWRVETLHIQPEAFQPSLTLYGRLESPLRLTSVAPMAGRIGELPVRDGELVDEGELLVALDEADVMPRLQQARADLADAESQLENARLAHKNDQSALKLERRIQANANKALERMQQLVDRGLSPQAELDAATDALDRAALTVAIRERNIEGYPSRMAGLQARVERARAELESTQRDVERSRFRAPFDGVVGEVRVAVGDQVAANAALLDFYPLRDMELRATLPQIYSQAFISALNNGKRLPATALNTDPPVQLTLQRIAGQADTRGVEALFKLDQPHPGLRAGNLLAISVARPASDNSVALPYSSIYGNDTIYQLLDGRMHRLAIQQVGEILMESGERWVLVQSPELQPGMQIITTHLPNAMKGLKVDAVEADKGNPPEPAR
ncbi:efflux RND transporter periplasmic adaptor subunit [Pseudomonas sp. OIL-1]|uniref:efflux RND transporter periplasmic adaptor subunit n=1 Tax=Pseudomonas sp. OIL-1 TaxID=2706126 RepID=UPI0013A729F5|nr:HlyD family efflux transporter periplasmic adaptor subunit [Pseudomonas sp. OIL-1]QIB50166.1 HlyD family efflux transporter periplasmic adaptor subunit [Pseudomonas sp. OIL-1]